MPIPIYQVDAFTPEPFKGNPAAVCLLSKEIDAQWMQHVAAEMNLAETAFVRPAADGFDLRWFTPTVEVDLCGHATLASAHVLWESGQLPGDEPARFHTRSGLLVCRKRNDWIEMDFPTTPAEPIAPPDGLFQALGISKGTTARSKFDYLVELETPQQVQTLNPDFAMLKRVGMRGVIVTARASGEFDYVCRFFGPQSGVDEDPVTGSAHCCLGPWWKDRTGKTDLVGHQISHRGGVVRVKVAGDRTLLLGQAVTILRGELSDRTASF